MNNPPFVGLCAACQHVRPVHSAKGSLFVLCDFAKIDSRFPKYPPLPVLHCPAFQPRPPSPQPDPPEPPAA